MTDDIVARSRQLDEEIAGSGAIRDLERAGRRSWLVLRVVVVSLIFDLILSAGLTYTAWQARMTAERAQSNEVRIRTACMTINETHAQERQLWEYVLRIPPTTPQTPESLKQRADFEAYVNHLYAPRDCGR
jgi:hypothetical protein